MVTENEDDVQFWKLDVIALDLNILLKIYLKKLCSMLCLEYKLKNQTTHELGLES